MIINFVRKTTQSRVGGGIRLMLALIFLMAGPAKLLVPRLAAAWAGQLSAASIPFEGLSRVAVPYLEILLGLIPSDRRVPACKDRDGKQAHDSLREYVRTRSALFKG